MTFLQISIFLAVAEQRSFSKAAEELFLSQSSVSKNVRSLENELGRPLFVRSPTQCSLSEYGESVLEHFQRFYEEYDRLLNTRNEACLTARHVLQIASMPILSPYRLWRPLQSYVEANPSVRTCVNETSMNKALDSLIRGQSHFAFIRGRKQDPSIFQSLVLDSDDLACVASAKHALACKPFLTLNDLRGQPLIMADRDGDVGDRVGKACGKEGFSPIHACDASRPDSAVSLAAAGLGVAVLFAREAAAALSPSVRLVPIVPQMSSQIMLVWLDNRITEEHQRRFLSCMKQRAEALPGDLRERPSDLS